MRHYIILFKSWFEQRNLREQLLVILLSWAILYAFFYLVFFRHLDYQIFVMTNDVKELKHQQANWKNQIAALEKLANSALYKQWVKKRQAFLSLQGQYKSLQHNSPLKQWQDIIKTILQTQSNITLVQVKNFPEAPYNNANNAKDIMNMIYQQQLMLVFLSGYFDTVNYLKRLEQVLPNIHWDSLDYEVTQYPIAKVEMEFSIFYEKKA